jgi:hypothetical protein
MSPYERPLALRLLAPVLTVVLTVCGEAAGGCAPEGPSLVVLGNLQPDLMCVVSANSEVYVLHGRYDVAGPSPGYVVNMRVASQLVPRASNRSVQPRAEPNHVLIEGAVVTLSGGGGAPLPAGISSSYTVSVAATIPVGGTGGVGFGVVPVVAIPPSVAAQLAAAVPTRGAVVDVDVTIELFGRTAGDVTVAADPWTWPVQVCNGCLDNCALAAVMMTMCAGGYDNFLYCSTPAVP